MLQARSEQADIPGGRHGERGPGRRLERTLAAAFPRAAPAPVTRAHVAMVAAAIAAGTVLVLLRQTGPGSLDTVWAEDGDVFLEQARTTGPLAALTTSYAGYWHLAPRLLAEVAAAVPVGRAAAVMAVGAALAQSALAVFVYVASGGVIRSRPVRFLVAGTMLLLPIGQAEVFGSIANVHWFLVPAAVWALLWNPTSRWERRLAAAVLVLAALSDPLLVLLAPLALARLWVGRQVASRTPAVAFLVAVGVHLGSVLVVRPQRLTETGSGGPGRVVSWFVFDVAGRGALGTRSLGDPDGRWEQVAATAVLVVLVALLVVAVRRGAEGAVPAAVLATSALALFVVPVAIAGTHPPRYSVGPVVLVASALAAAWPCLPHRAQRVGPAILVGLVVVWSANLRLDNERSDGPRWSDAVDQATDQCRERPSATGSVELPITPPGWDIRLTCADLR